MDKRAIVIVLCFLCYPLVGQEIIPYSYFHKDSVKIGEEVPYSLWIKYPIEKDVAFPDSLFDFSPFELNRRVYFTTKSDSVESLDSAVYYFSTYEIDSVQYLTLPVQLINEYDSTTLLTHLDSIILNQVVTILPDSVAVLINTEYHKVPLAFNYPYFTIGIVILGLIVFAVFIVFGNRIRKTIQVYWISNRQKKFEKSFSLLLQSNPLEVEKALRIWKSYLEKLLSLPYTKLTSKEINILENEPGLRDHLRIIDGNIYGGYKEAKTVDAFNSLLAYSKIKFHAKIKEVKNG